MPDTNDKQYLDSIIKWDDAGRVSDIHFPFGKLSLDMHNRVVDRGFINKVNLR